MATSKKKKSSGKGKPKYLLTPVKDGKDAPTINADSKDTARAMYDYVKPNWDSIRIVKVLSREITRDDLAAISRPRPAATDAPAGGKSK